MKCLIFTLLVLLVAGCSVEDNPDAAIEIVDTTADALNQAIDKAMTEDIVEISDEATHEEPRETEETTKTVVIDPEKQGCEGAVELTYPPAELSNIEKIVPLGQMQDSHVTPTDHQYYYLKSSGDVFAPAAGRITEIEHMPGSDNDDFRIILHHSCTLYSIYIHLNGLSERIEGLRDGLGAYDARYLEIPVEAGEKIGSITNQWNSFDYSLHDEDVILGFISPELYEGEPWKIHTVDPYDYFAEPLRSQLLEKNLRSAEPLGGKIDYDIAGTLAGNWFAEGTDYSGSQNEYWSTHASFAYDHFDPETITISLGDFYGESEQFFAKGPDPADVTESTGIVKYSLFDRDYTARNQRWDRHSYVESLKGTAGSPQGTVLVQITGSERIKLEAFKGDASSFTSEAKVYER